MKNIVAALALTGLMVAGSAMATDMPALAKKNGCVACHSIDKKIMGPAWMDVSKKYKGDKGAQAKMVEKLKEGKGHMKVNASDAELKAAVGYALSAK